MQTGRHTHNPNQQRRHRKRGSPPLSLQRPNNPLLLHKHPLPLPHLPHLLARHALLAFRRHNRHSLQRLRPPRRLTPDRLHRLQSRPSRLPRLPPLRNRPNLLLCITSRRCKHENDSGKARTAFDGNVLDTAIAIGVLWAGGAGEGFGEGSSECD